MFGAWHDEGRISKGRCTAVKSFFLRCHLNVLEAETTISLVYLNKNFKTSQGCNRGKSGFLKHVTGSQIFYFSVCYKILHFLGEINSLFLAFLEGRINNTFLMRVIPSSVLCYSSCVQIRQWKTTQKDSFYQVKFSLASIEVCWDEDRKWLKSVT